MNPPVRSGLWWVCREIAPDGYPCNQARWTRWGIWGHIMRAHQEKVVIGVDPATTSSDGAVVVATAHNDGTYTITANYTLPRKDT